MLAINLDWWFGAIAGTIFIGVIFTFGVVAVRYAIDFYHDNFPSKKE